MKKYFVFVLLLISFNIYSDENMDSLISAELFKTYNKDLDINNLKKVLEYDSLNSPALLELAALKELNNESLYLIQKIYEMCSLDTLESKYRYITVLYKLKKYNTIINLTTEGDLNSCTNPTIIYYVLQSLHNLNKNESFSKHLKDALYKFPNNPMILELSYLEKKDKNIIRFLYNNKYLDSFLRLYNLENEHLYNTVFEYFIDDYFRINNFQNVIINYKFINYIKKDEKIIFNANGTYLLDENSDSIVDIKLKIIHNKLIQKSSDINQDNIYEYNLKLKDNMPYEISYNNIFLKYNKYPFIDSITYFSDNNKTVYYLKKDEYRYKIGHLYEKTIYPENTDIDEFNLEYIIIEKYKSNSLILKKIYNNKNSYIEYSEPNQEGNFTYNRLIKNNIIESGLKDLNNDGIFDLNEIYLNGKLAARVYSSNGESNNISYIEYLNDKHDLIKRKVDFNWLNK